jgi:3-phosphoshikimate 1-carboxyvinyltransferase
MADLLIRPGQLCGRVIPPPSKSDAHRALIAAALAGRPDLVQGLPEPLSDDIRATRRCLAALLSGARALDCGESGTTLRLLIPIAAALGSALGSGGKTVFSGVGRLPERPLAEYQAIFAGHGVEICFPPDGKSLPLHLAGQLRGGTFRVPGHISSQYVSGLLFALPLAAADSQIHLTTPLESAPYVAMTLRTLRHFGIQVDETADGYRVPGGQTYRPAAWTVEKDYSQAAFWLTAAYSGSAVEVCGLDPASAQGDKAIIRLLADFGRGLPEYRIDAADIPDLVPALAVAAALTPAVTRIVRASRLRLKESDRLESIEGALQAIGADICQTADGLLIRGTAARVLRGGETDSFADHRIAMAAAIAALRCREGVLLRRAEAVRKSYPEFFREFRRLGGDLDELHVGANPENQLVW